MDAILFLEKTSASPPGVKVQPIYVLQGEEHFLRRQALAALRRLVLGPDDDGFNLSRHSGDKATYAAVKDELETLPFLGGRRLVVVEGADPFVTRERARLEQYFASPSGTGVLVLEVSAWPATTRLAKALSDKGLIACKALSAQQLTAWCRQWASARHGKQLPPPAAQMLVDLAGPDMGLLDQELAKLAVYVGDAARIEPADVDALVGNNRTENTWAIFDLIGTGQVGAALTRLERLLEQGDEPLRLLGAFSSQLRRLVQAARLHAGGLPLSDALTQAGVHAGYPQRCAEQQIRHLGPRRLDRVYDWLLQTDVGLKTSHQLPARTLLERLVVQLARPSADKVTR
jgi:DNA polymerase-3 subunit delta